MEQILIKAYWHCFNEVVSFFLRYHIESYLILKSVERGLNILYIQLMLKIRRIEYYPVEKSNIGQKIELLHTNITEDNLVFFTTPAFDEDVAL